MATRLAAELQESFGIQATLQKGHSGVFDVLLDGGVVFSKYAEGRHADAGEIVGRLRDRGFG